MRIPFMINDNELQKIKIQITEVEGMTIKIPTEFTAFSFNQFYKQMLLI